MGTIRAMFVSASENDPVQLKMSADELALAHKIATHIRLDFDGCDFGILKNRKFEQVEALIASLQQVINDNQTSGEISFRLSREDYSVLLDVILFADGYPDDEFSENMPMIEQMSQTMFPGWDIDGN